MSAAGYAMTDIVLNTLIFGITLVLIVRFFRKDGQWAPERGKAAFRFFTSQSNALCAAAALVTAVFRLRGEVPYWAWILKYTGTAAVTVTMLTVFFFLAPSVGKDWVKVLLKGQEFFLHLLTPLLALVSFCVFEKQGMTFPESLWGLLPVALYGPLYLYKTVYAPEGKRWNDFYGFNKTGKWPLSFAAMFAGTFAVCAGIMALQNL